MAESLLPVDHLADVPSQLDNQSGDQFLTSGSSGGKGFLIVLVAHGVVADVFREGGQGESRLELLGVSRPALGREVGFGDLFRQQVPVGNELQVALEPLQKLAPHSVTGSRFRRYAACGAR